MATEGKGGAAEALLRVGNHLTRSEPLDGTRAQVRTGGRAENVFYRDRWSHDKIVRSTHGVNCTGSCSWDVYDKDGITTWEAQATDYPSVGPDRPEYVRFSFAETFMFYLPRICEHRLNPTCVATCPSGALYKRAEDETDDGGGGEGPAPREEGPR